MDSSLAHLISWAEPSKGTVPLPLTGPSITISPLPHPHPPTAFLFGGKYVHNRKLTNEMWAMDLNTRLWQRVEAGPGPGSRYFHSMDIWEDKLVCFGGMSDSEPNSVHNDLWFFDCASRKWLPSQLRKEEEAALLPSARYAHLSAVSHGKLILSGGQHADNSWLYEMNLYDLKTNQWISKTMQPEANGLHSKGAYRSVCVSSKQRVITPEPDGDTQVGAKHSYSIDEDGEGGDVWCYSNYDFAKVRRELEVLSPRAAGAEPPSISPLHDSPPEFAIRDHSARMHGAGQPPGLRFPTGGIVGNHLILSGLYLASSSAAFSIWSLNLDNLSWRHLEPTVLNTGSWNRAVIWPERAKILIFGNIESDLASDYSKRAVNVDHIAVVSLETFGIYRPPRLEIPDNLQVRSLTALDEQLMSDFEIIADDGRRIKCSRQLLRERWAWFAQEEEQLVANMSGHVLDKPSIDIADTLLGSFEPSRLAPTNLTLQEPFPVCVALVQYFYTLSLSTALQNRAPVLSALLFLAKQYKIDRLARLVVHCLHERLQPNTAVGIYEIATLCGEQNLQIRALSMIHQSGGRGGSRAHRKGPSVDSEVGQSAPQTGGPPRPQPTSASNGTQEVLSPSIANTPGGTLRQARAESPTLVDLDEVDKAERLIDALRLTSTRGKTPDIFRPDSAILPARQSSLPMDPPSTSIPPTPALILRSDAHSPETPCLTLDDRIDGCSRTSYSASATDTYPSTPSEAFPPSLPGYRAPSISSGQLYGLGLSDIPPRDGLPYSTSEEDERKQPFGDMEATFNRSFHIRSSSFTRGPPHSLSRYQAQALAHRHDADLSSHAKQQELHHRASIDTKSSLSPSDASGFYRNNWVASVPSTPNSMDINIQLGTTARSKLTTIDSRISVPDSVSVSSHSTGDSSARRSTKEEKKAIQAAEKEARKFEAQTKFEVLRSEQMEKIARARVEAQRKAEAAKYAPPKPKAESKSKLGKFGRKFADVVLFPEGASNSNYF